MREQIEEKFGSIVLSDITELIRHTNKIKKKLESLIKIDKDIMSVKPYEFEKQYLDLKKLYTSPPFSELLRETLLYKNLNDFCEQELKTIEKYKEEFHFALGTKLKELMTVFAQITGQLPVLKVKFYTIKFDFANGSASIWWGPQNELIKKVAIEPSIIYQTINSFDKSLTEMWKQPEDFINLLKSAYKRYVLVNSLEFGTKVNLLDLLSECVMLIQSKSFKADPTKNHFTEYSRIQFSYDLYKMKTSVSFMANIQLSVATFAVTENRQKSLWVPDNEDGDGTYYQQIAFNK